MRPTFMRISRRSFVSLLARLGLCIILLLVIGVGSTLWKVSNFYQHIYQSSSSVSPPTPSQMKSIIQPAPLPSSLVTNLEPITILLVGIDRRPSETQSRSDSLVLAVVNPKSKSIQLLPIPRDTYAFVPGYGQTKINHAMFYGGIHLLKKTVSGYFHVPVNRYMIVDFNGFTKVVDDLGGLKVNVEKNMNYDDPTDGTHIHLHSGVNQLTGQQVLGYARFRHDLEADSGRMHRQQEVLKLLAEKVKTVQTWPKLFPILDHLGEHLQTDIAPVTMVQLIKTFHDYPSSEIKTLSLAGVNEINPSDDLWYFFVKEEERHRIANFVRVLLREE
ncbi:MAG: hypothetical protein JWN30_242 [Bacilli bacterium]|nr:hypothetical protein [Bacilli bacterium]